MSTFNYKRLAHQSRDTTTCPRGLKSATKIHCSEERNLNVGQHDTAIPDICTVVKAQEEDCTIDLGTLEETHQLDLEEWVLRSDHGVAFELPEISMFHVKASV